GTLRAVITRGGGPVRGTLATNAQTLRVTLEGLGAAAPAPARVEVNGQLFGIGRTDQVVGTYRPVGDGAGSAQVNLTGGLNLGNDNLVVMRLWPGREGQVLTAAPDGVRLRLGN
ncbi:MAG: hypothetical protein K2X74_04985, partial [Acetobacteraceae bacterium]|nr:hypothetical protein [Acetobacteraceae bacterium]